MPNRWKILLLLFATHAEACRSLDRCNAHGVPADDAGAERIVTSTAALSRERRLSRALGGEIGQFGLITLVDIGDDTPNLRVRLLQEAAEAEANHARCLFVTTVTDCPSCAVVGYIAASGELGRAAGKLRLVRIDLDEFEDEIRALSLPIDRVPGFVSLGASGQIQDYLDASDWVLGTPAEFTSMIAKFLEGRLDGGRASRHTSTDSRAVDL